MSASRDNSKKLDASVHYLPIATASTVLIGDLLAYNTTDDVVARFSAWVDAVTYVGVAGSKYPPASTENGSIGDQVKVYKTGIFEFDLNTTGTAYKPNDEFKWSSGGNVVAVNAATSNSVGRVWKAVSTADSTVQLRIDKYVAF